MNTLMRIAAALFLMSGLSGQTSAQSLQTLQPANDVSGAPAAGARLARHWITAPDARCNDGTRAAAYVRRAGTLADRDRWVIYLQGGGSCEDDQDCLDRWQSTDNNYGLQKMSTSIPIATWNGWYPGAGAPSGWTAQGAQYAVPISIAPQGLFSAAAANPFANWNQVFLYYCSSDQWIGEKELHAASAVDQLPVPPPPPGLASPYEIAFQGAAIFDGLINDLRTGLGYCLGENCQQMPTLNDARSVLLAGSSAGANGVKHQLDRFRAQQLAIKADTDVRGLIDAAGAPDPHGLPWPTPPAAFSDATEYFRKKWDNTYISLWDARVDASCLSENPGVESRCANATHVLNHHLTSPFFHRMDLQDSLSLRPYLDLFFPPANYGPTVAPLKLAYGVARQLVEVNDSLTWLLPRYPNELATVAADAGWIASGVFGPRCGDHVGLLGNRTFLLQELAGPGALINYADAVYAWVTSVPGGIAGATPPALIATAGIGPSSFAACN